jgi:16S rRNA (guanine527-N7)-methyltransferase
VGASSLGGVPAIWREAAARVFGEHLPLAEAFAGHLATSAVQRGLIGPREVPRLWERHILNCAVVGELVPTGAGVVDVGSGAGLPGLALAVARPDLRVVLVEPLQRRVDWLSEVVQDLGLQSVEVRRARAEELRGVVQADMVTARAVAALPRLAAWCLPLVHEAGALLALKGRSAAEELTASVRELRAAGAIRWEVVTAGAGLLPEPTTVVRVVRGPLSWDVTSGDGERRGAARRPRRL